MINRPCIKSWSGMKRSACKIDSRQISKKSRDDEQIPRRSKISRDLQRSSKILRDGFWFWPLLVGFFALRSIKIPGNSQ
jgi:hypothetical protein